jgi:riboflavin kinase/FMN adenylyltransferase
MRVFNGIEELLKAISPAQGLQKAVVTIGNFDGVHRGHQKLIQILRQRQEDFHAPSVVMTFHPHPVQVLAPEKNIMRLFTWEDQAQQLESLGVDFLIRQAFDQKLAKTPAEIFLENYLLRPLNPQALIVGHDFRFGAGRAGDIEMLRKWGAERKIRVDQVPAYKISGQIVSTTQIREHLKQAHLAAVHELLGRNYVTEGLVIHGDGRGEKLGFKTANVAAPANFPLPKGVYVTQIRISDRQHPAVTNVGVNPTFEDPLRPLRIESFIFDLKKDIYGENIQVEFLKFLRIEKKFKDAQELIEQINSDVERAKDYWRGSH